MIPLTKPQSIFEEDYHRHDFYDEDGKHLATIEFDEIDEEGGGKLWCEIAVWVRIGTTGDRPLIAFERVNLLNTGAAKGWLMSIVAKLKDIGAVNWEQGLETAVYDTILEYRATSSEGQWLTPLDGDDEDASDPYLLEPFIASTGTTILFGKHGSAKSMMATRWSLSVATGMPLNGVTPNTVGPVLYVDFEDTPEPHQYRLHAIGTEMGLKPKDLEGLIYHERVTRSLKDSRRRIRRIIRREGIVLVVIDSIGLARAADVSGSEATIKLFKTFSSMGVAVLAIDHLTKEDNKRIAVGKMNWREATPIGSQFTESSARLGWFLNELPQSTSKSKVSNLYNTKHNHTPQHTPIGLTVNLEWNKRSILTKVEFILVEATHDAVVAELGARTKSQELLVWHYTQQGENKRVIPMTTRALEQSGIKGSTIRGTVTESPWWEQIEGSKEYTLSTLGLEAATYFNSMFGQNGTESDD